MRFKLFVALMLISVALVATTRSTNAQTPAATNSSADCKPSSVFNTLSTLKSSGDNEKDLTTLQGLVGDIDAQVIACHGMTFKGDKGQKVTGPYDFPAGDYKATTTTAGSIILDLKGTKDSTCSEFGNDVSLVSVSQGNAISGSEQIVTIKDKCRAYLSIGLATDAWTLTLEPLQ